MRNDLPGWFRPGQAAEYLSISKRTLVSWMRNGLIQYSKVNGIVLLERTALDDFLHSKTIQSAADRVMDEMCKG